MKFLLWFVYFTVLNFVFIWIPFIEIIIDLCWEKEQFLYGLYAKKVNEIFEQYSLDYNWACKFSYQNIKNFQVSVTLEK